VQVNVDHLLRAHAYLRTEAPPEPWQPEADDERLFPLLGEMIVAGLSRGNELGAITLAVANVVISPEAAGRIPEGELVAITIRGAGDWTPERTWSRSGGAEPSPFWSADLEAALEGSDAVHAYLRQTSPEEGSITVLFRRSTQV
jgi:hypothetical protein